jgi:hypothetical protein
LASEGKILRWSVLQLSQQGEIVDVYHSRGKTPQAAFKNLPPHIRENLRKYTIEPFSERLHVCTRRKFTFEVPGLKGENAYTFKVHEYYNGIGFSYQPLFETGTYLERIAPVAVVRDLAMKAANIFGELKLRPRSITIGIKDPGVLLGGGGYGGRAIVSKGRSVYIELELFDFALRELDYWEGVLWHEVMHAKYTLERRWPSIWPFYKPDAGPLWALDCLVHFSIDGYLEKNNKPTVYWVPPNEPDADFKSSRLYELREGLQNSGCMVAESVLTKVADNLWGRETNIWEIWKIIQEFGLTIPEVTPLGQYLKRHKNCFTGSTY